MKEFSKNILKWLHIYHPLQSFYRNIIFFFRNNMYRRRYKKYAGSGYCCNVCGSKYQQFVPDDPMAENKDALVNNHVIAGYGKNVFCPNCMSTSRERLVIAMLKEKLQLDGKKLLHLSPEKNVYGFIRPKATVITADLNPGFYKTIDGLVQKQDANRLSFADNSFDMVIANHVLEHIPDDRLAMREIFRVIIPGGMAVLQIPFSMANTTTIESPGISDPAMQSRLYGQKDHVRIYALKDYVSRLMEAGFVVKVIPYEELQPYYVYAIQEAECFLLIHKPVNA